MAASAEWSGAISAFCPSVVRLARRVHKPCGLSRFRIVSSARRPIAALPGLPSRRQRPQALSLQPEGAAAAFAMKNGLYSVHTYMLDGVKGRDSGVLIFRDGVFLGGGPYFWSTGTYTVANGTWKGDLRTNQHTPFPDFVRPLFGGHEVTSGFSGTFTDDQAEVFGTSLVGTRSLSFRATLKRLADE
jgi:hypothetical protein